MRIKGLSLLIWVCFGLLSPVFGQKVHQALITNLQITQEEDRVKITYDAADLLKSDSVFVRAQSRTKGLINVTAVTGAVGKGQQSGKGKVIYWDIQKDGALIDGEMAITVVTESINNQSGSVGGGPANALLSVLVPGLGNVMVQPNHRIGFRPLITVAYGGLLIYGLSQRSQSNKQYQLYQSQTLEEQAEPYYTKANQARHQYLIATRAAAAILVADVVYTAIKGTSNLKKQRAQLSLGFQQNTPLIGFRYTL